jgi:hypothetical protein
VKGGAGNERSGSLSGNYMARQGHLQKGEDTEAFSSLLWSRNCTSKTVGARPNLRPNLM